MSNHPFRMSDLACPGGRADRQDARYDLATEVCGLQAQALVHERIQTTPAGIIIDWCQRAHDCLAQLDDNDPAGIKQWQDLLTPFFLKSNFLKRCHDKPRGYAGDYLTIQMMYDGLSGGLDHFGQAVDTWAMGQPCPRAVRNRRRLVADFVRNIGETFPSPSVVSLGCGPASEVFDSLGMDSARFTLIDIDADAIGYVRAKARLHSEAARINTIRGNIIRMALRDEGHLPGNHAAFYSMGLIDYFNDDLVVRLLNYIHGKLAPGGAVFLGNFRPDHPNVALFRYALDWPLVLRSEQELLRLVAQSRFASSPVNVGTEAEGVQLFVTCVKPHS
jgi:extracellular factor (EF) 3-hydroxypalmitic acid methyl ester biosynthesis protein